jgi:hypothetical protein
VLFLALKMRVYLVVFAFEERRETGEGKNYFTPDPLMVSCYRKSVFEKSSRIEMFTALKRLR